MKSDTEIKFNFHDSCITSITFPMPSQVLLTIDLYPIYYPEIAQVEVEFWGILNLLSVSKYFIQILEDADTDPEAGFCRSLVH